ncbi:hypothetical protein F2Q68_00025700 [Brassica cretica]|uniref:Uncharacterized protein n=1 Tax=Brassica cretica TaxID=69181 RepID=A0A8S9IF79_BRACR|nr:hypothetical protein F2Q68_00025700 [Brassica cretica]
MSQDWRAGEYCSSELSVDCLRVSYTTWAAWALDVMIVGGPMDPGSEVNERANPAQKPLAGELNRHAGQLAGELNHRAGQLAGELRRRMGHRPRATI